MAFEWGHYLLLARELSQRTDEAALRSVISRAYYAAYHAARQNLVVEGTAFYTDPNDHTAVWNAYRFSGDAGVRAYIGSDGNSLRRARNLADYASEIQGLPDLTRRCLQKAEQVMNGLDRLVAAQQPLPEPPKT